MKWLLVLVAIAACNNDVDQPWELAHDRIIAVQAEPPGIVAGEQSKLMLLLGFKDSPATEKAPDLAQVVQPMSLADLVHRDGADWVVDAPTDDRLAAARTELKLMPDEPVPLTIGVAVAWPTPVVSPMGNGFAATKTVFLGMSATNPPIENVSINGADPGSDPIAASLTGKTLLSVDGDDNVDIINWLTSAGTMHDFDLHSAYITFEKDDMTEGQLALVYRDNHGGVNWRLWSISAQ